MLLIWVGNQCASVIHMLVNVLDEEEWDEA